MPNSDAIKRATPKIDQFWIRSLGFSKDLSRIKSLAQLEPAEQAFAAILRADRAAAEKQLSNTTQKELLTELNNLIQANNFASLVYERIIDLELTKYFLAPSNNVTTSTIEQIKVLAKTGAISHFHLDQRFAKVLEIVKDHHNFALWIKGAELSRRIYSPAYFRPYGDLDVVVKPSRVGLFIESLMQAGFRSFASPEYCHQLGAGPVRKPVDLFLAPLAEWVPNSPITLSRKDGLTVDIKVGPFDRGIQAVEFERMFVDAQTSTCLTSIYLAPNNSDHLMILLCNFSKDRFTSWKSAYDIHLLVAVMNKDPNSWKNFICSCKNESIAVTAYLGLSIAKDRLSTEVPQHVLSALAPNDFILSPLLSCTVSPAFVWNSTSLPMMILNIFSSSDRRRKLSILLRSIFPSQVFLREYYSGDNGKPQKNCIKLLLRHWCILILPAGLVRRTVGKNWWSAEIEF